MGPQLLWNSFLSRFEDYDLESKIRILRRYPRRRLICIACIIIFLIYVFSAGGGSESPSTVKQCVNDRLRHWSQKFDDLAVGVDHSAIPFIGNGHIAVDSSGQLRVSMNGSRVVDFATGFYPLVNSSMEGSSASAESILTDYVQGHLLRIQCYLIDNECACITRKSFVHRTRPNVIIEEVQIINPTRSSITANIEHRDHSGWTKAKSSNDLSVYYKHFTAKRLGVAALCSNAPGKITVSQKREEVLRFTCVVGREYSSPEVTSKSQSDMVIQGFVDIKGLPSSDVDKEHTDAWAKLNSVSFYLSHSKAPTVLNGDRINATRYAILSNSKAPTLEIDVAAADRKKKEEEAKRTELCYSGHSTLLYPSKLWKDLKTDDELLRTADLWLLTLEKMGCAHVVSSGALGVAQSFVLSLTGCSFHNNHLEMDMKPHELHREMTVEGMPLGGAKVAIRVLIDEDNTPYMEVSSSSILYACDAGCLDEPVTLTSIYTRLPVKVTKPSTSILYVASSRKHLEQLRSTIHVSEVGAAPAHEHEVLSLHRTGSAFGGLPTWFWFLLGVLLIAFHVFLAKLLWSEWRKGDMTPYNPYLRSRYSYVRSH